VSAKPEHEEQIKAAWEARSWDRAATLAIEAYGAELMSYLAALLHSASDADDVFGVVSEQLWRSLPGFRWESSFRTYAYTVARHAWLQHLRDPRNRRRAEPLSSPSVEAVVAQVRTRTATYLRTETKDTIAKLRAQLDPDDQTLLILRINRKLAWREIATIMAEDGADLSSGAIDRRAAALRKRFERLKAELRARAGQRQTPPK